MGDTATYEILVTNIGNLSTTTNTILQDPMPVGLSLVSASGSGWDCAASTSALVSCTYAAVLAPGASAPVITVEVEVGIGAITGVTNVATVNGGGDSDPNNDSGIETSDVLPPPAPAPALGRTAMIASLLLMAAVAAFAMRRRRQTLEG